jgi:hypothetical protein
MQYKTIVLELLQQRPEMHDQLRRHRLLLPAVEAYSMELKTSHEAWKGKLALARPGSDPGQMGAIPPFPEEPGVLRPCEAGRVLKLAC